MQRKILLSQEPGRTIRRRLGMCNSFVYLFWIECQIHSHFINITPAIVHNDCRYSDLKKRVQKLTKEMEEMKEELAKKDETCSVQVVEKSSVIAELEVRQFGLN
jgi:hypothetical protein